jgi:hypothetical protein
MNQSITDFVFKTKVVWLWDGGGQDKNLCLSQGWMNHDWQLCFYFHSLYMWLYKNMSKKKCSYLMSSFALVKYRL